MRAKYELDVKTIKEGKDWAWCVDARGGEGVKPAFHMIATIAVKNGSAIAAIDGFHMIFAIAEWRPGKPGSNNIVRAIPQIQHGGCESSTPTWGVFSCNYGCFTT